MFLTPPRSTLCLIAPALVMKQGKSDKAFIAVCSHKLSGTGLSECLETNRLHCLSQAAGAKYLSEVRVGQWSACSHLLLLPLGVPPVAALAGFTFGLSHVKIWRVVTTIDVGNATQGPILWTPNVAHQWRTAFPGILP